jgi:hypothetical protein
MTNSGSFIKKWSNLLTEALMLARRKVAFTHRNHILGSETPKDPRQHRSQGRDGDDLLRKNTRAGVSQQFDTLSNMMPEKQHRLE